MIIDRSKKIKRNRKRSNPCNFLSKACQIKWIISVKQILSENCKVFCDATSLHGFCYIFEQTDDREPANFRKIRQAISFVVWTTIVLIGIIFGLYLMILAWNKYESTPTITTIETDIYPIRNIPFPGVTICSTNSVFLPSTKNLTELLLLRGIQKNRIQTFYSNLAKLTNYKNVNTQYSQIFSILEELGYTTEKLMYELMHPCKKLIFGCLWLGKAVPCMDIIRTVKSAMGFCCSFNYQLRLPPPKNGEPSNSTIDPIRYVHGCGEDVGLFAIVYIQPKNYVSSRKNFYGAEIIIHNPEEYPESQLTTVAELGNEIVITVNPTVLYADKDVESLSIKARNCLFDSESNLKTTKAYSFQSCMSECRAKTIVEKCGCLPFFYYNFLNATRQCTLQDSKCLSANKHIFASWQPPNDIKALFNNSKDIGMMCDCYPGCTEKRYEAGTYKLDLSQVTFTKDVQNNINNKNNIVVKVYFRTLTCLTYRRQMFLTWDGVLSSLGGVFGICLGGSVVSLIELAYFLTFKMFDLIDDHKNKEFQANNSTADGQLFTVQKSKDLPVKCSINLKRNEDEKIDREIETEN